MRVLQLHNDHASLGGALEVMLHEGQILRDGGHEVDQFVHPAAERMGISARAPAPRRSGTSRRPAR